MRDAVHRAAAAAALRLTDLLVAVAAASYDLTEVPEAPSDWVGEARQEVAAFAARLAAAAPALSPAAAAQVPPP